MTAHSKYLASLLNVFSTFLESRAVSKDLAVLTTEFFVVFISTKKNYQHWTITELDTFLKAQSVPHKSSILLKKFITEYTPHEVDVFLHEFLSSLKLDNKSDSTIKNYRSDIQQLVEHSQKLSLDELFKPEVIRAFVLSQLEEGLKKSTIKRKLTSLTQFAQWTESENLVKDVSFWIADSDQILDKNHRKPASQPQKTPEQTSAQPDIKVEKALNNYLTSLEIDGHSPVTIKNYRSDISQLLELNSDTPLKKLISEKTITRFVTHQKKIGLKTTTIKRKLSSITQFALWCESKHLIHSVSNWIDSLSHLVTEPELIPTTPQTHSVSTSYPQSTNKKTPFQLKLKDHGLVRAHEAGAKHTAWTLPTPGFTKNHHIEKPKTVAQTDGSSSQSTETDVFSGIRSNLQEFAHQINTKRNRILLPYINLALLLIFVIGLGYLAYQQFILQAPAPLAFPSSPVRPNRELSFQGRLTDTAQNPITSATDMAFRLYDNNTGGTQLWSSGTCSVTPDQDGIFNVGLGDDCGSEITEDVFSENSNVWLEVEVDAETLTPRQSIKTVPYALNSETVQGYPVTASGAATVNTILTMDSAGNVVLGEVSPTLRAVSGTFAIEAQTLSLQTSAGSNGDILLSPDGTGTVIVQSDLDLEGYLSAPGATFSATYAGGTALIARGGPSGTANIQEWQNSAGTALSVVDENGNFGIGTSNPNGKVYINTGTDENLRINSGSTVYGGTSGIGIQALDDAGTGVVQLVLDGSSVVIPRTSTNVGIGTTSANTKLEIADGNDGGGGVIWAKDGGAVLMASNGNYPLQVGNNTGGANSVRFRVDVNGKIEAGSASYYSTAADPGYSFFNDTDTGFFTPTGNVIGFTTGGNERVRIDTNGNVGIGSTSPGYALDLVGEFNLTDAIRVAGDAGSNGYLLTSSAGGAMTWTDPASLAASDLWANTNNVLHPKDALAEVVDLIIGGTSTASANIQLRSDGQAYFGGNVGIGTTAPAQTLDIWSGSQHVLKITPGTSTNGTVISGYRASDNGEAQFIIGISKYDFPSNGGNVTFGSSTAYFGQTSGQAILRRDTGNPRLRFWDAPNGYEVNLVDGSDLAFLTTTDNFGGTTERIRFQSDGNVGIGSASPGYALDLVGEFNLTDAIRVAGDAGTSGYLFTSSAGGANTWTNPYDLLTAGWLTNTLNVLHPKNEYAEVVDLIIGGTSTASANIHLKSNGQAYFGDNVGIGTTTPDNLLELSSTTNPQLKITHTPGTDETTIGVDANGLLGIIPNGGIYLYADPGQASRSILAGRRTINSTGNVYGYNIDLHKTGTGGAAGILAFTYADSSGSSSTLDGGYLQTEITGAYTMNWMYGLRSLINNNSGATVNNDLIGIQSRLNGTLGTVTGDAAFFQARNSLTSATVTNLFGLHVEEITQGTNNYAIYTEGATQSYFGGNVGIGSTSPGYALDVVGELNLTDAIRVAGDAGTSGYFLTSSAGGANTWTDPDTITGAGLWDITSNVFHPKDEWAEVVDVVIGGTSTASANIRLASDGTGYFSNNVGIGTTSPVGLLNVAGSRTGQALVQLQENGDQDILTASNSAGTTRFRMANNGYLYAERFADISNENYYLDPAAAGTGLTIASNAGIGTTAPGARLDVRNSSTEDILNLFDGGTEVLTVIDGGNVGIGTSTPIAPLHTRFDDTVSATNYAMYIDDNPTVNGGNTNYGLYVNWRPQEGTGVNSSYAIYVPQFGGTGMANSSYAAYLGGRVGIGDTVSSSNLLKVQRNNGTNWLVDLHDTGSAGRVLHVDSDGTGDNPSFQVDSESTTGILTVYDSNKVGIGTSTPDTLLDVNNLFNVTSGGNVGIGSTSPGYALDVVGELNLTDAIRVAGDAGTSGYVLTSSAGGANTWTDPSTLGLSYWANTNNVLHPKNEYAEVVDVVVGGTSTASANVRLGSDGTGYFGGNVGIGTTAPSSKLTVQATDPSLIISSDTNNSGTTSLQFRHYSNGVSKTGIFSTAEGTWSKSTGIQFAINNANDGTGVSTSDTKMIITPNGNVGIGTTAPLAKLDTRGTILGNDFEIRDADGAASDYNYFTFDTDANGLLISANVSGSPGTQKRHITLTPRQSGQVIISNSPGTFANAVSLSVSPSTDFQATSGTYARIAEFGGTFAPTSGAVDWQGLVIEPTINQTGTATGDYTALLVNVTETAATGTNKYLADFQQGGTSRMVITGDGNVGIGTTSPSDTLDVLLGNNRYVNIGRSAATDRSSIRFSTAGTPAWYIGQPDSDLIGDGSEFYIGTSPSVARLLIDTNGNVGIGSTAPIALLDVAGTASISGVLTLNSVSAGGDNTVLILDDNGQVRQDEIDSRVWGSSLVDGSGTANRVAYWTDADTIAADDDFFFDGTNVGIGTTTPATNLQIVNTSAGAVTNSLLLSNKNTTNDSGASIGFNIASNDAVLADIQAIRTNVTTASDTDLRFRTTEGGVGIATRMTINHVGNVGIGTTSPTQELEVAGDIRLAQNTAVIDRTGNGSLTINGGSGAAGAASLYLQSQGNTIASLGDGSANAWNFRINQVNTGRTALVVQGIASATANLQEWQNSSGTALTFINAYGGIRSSYGPTLFDQSGIDNLIRNYAAGDAALTIESLGTTAVPAALIIKHNQVSQTGDLLQWQNSSGTVLSTVDVNGNIGIGSASPGYALDVVGELNLTDAIRVAGDAGTSGYVLTSSAGGANTWTDPSTLGLSYWANTNNVLHPKNEYAEVVDVVIGGTSTASADIQLKSNGDAYFGGSVGIGTTIPTRALDVNSGTTNFTAEFESTDDQMGIVLKDDDADFLTGITGTSFFIDRTTSFTSPDDFVLDGNGNIGMGTTSPQSKLHINGGTGTISTGLTLGDGDSGIFESSDDVITFATANTNRFALNTTDLRSVTSGAALIRHAASSDSFNTFSFVDDYDTGIRRPAADTLTFQTGGSERVRVDANGNVGIGTTTPAASLAIVADATNLRALRLHDNDTPGTYYADFKVDHVTDGAATLATQNLHLKLDSQRLITYESGGGGWGSQHYFQTGSDMTYQTARFMTWDAIWAPTSGTGRAHGIRFDYTVNQTGTNTSNYTLIEANAIETATTGTDNYLIDLQRSSTSRFFVRPDGTTYAYGNVGIGSTSPGYKLDVVGELNLTDAIRVAGDAGTSGYFLTSSAGGANTWTDPDTITGAGLWDITDNVFHPKDEWAEVVDVVIGGTSTASADIQLKSNGDAYFGGNVGIGSTSPTSGFKLDVAGAIRSTNGISLGGATNSGNNTVRSLGTLILQSDASSIRTGWGHTFQILNGSGGNAIMFRPSGDSYFTENLGIGNETPTGKFDVDGAVTGKALAILNETGDQNIFTASSSGTTKFIIDNDGDVAIGTTNPTNIGGTTSLHLYDTGGTNIVLEGNNGVVGGTAGSMQYGGNNAIYFSVGSNNYINGNDRVAAFNSNGNFGIGSTSPAETLDMVNSQNDLTIAKISNVNTGTAAVAGFEQRTASNYGATFYSFGSGYTSSGLNAPNSTVLNSFGPNGLRLVASNASGSIQFATGGAGTGNVAMTIDSNENVGIGSSSPGYLLDVAGELNLTDAIRVAGDAGTSGYVLTSSAGGANTWTDPSTLGLSYWANTNNVLHPKNEYAEVVDVVVGGTSTASANVRLGSDGTGYFGGNVSIGTTTSSELLTVNGGTTRFSYGSGGSTPTDGIVIKQRLSNVAGRSTMEIAGTNGTYWTSGTGIEFANHGASIEIGATTYMKSNAGAKTFWVGDSNPTAVDDFLIMNTADAGYVDILAMRYGDSTPGSYPDLRISAPKISFFTKTDAAWSDGSGYRNYGAEALTIDGVGNVGISSSSPIGLLNIDGAATGKALTILNETGDQAIFVASASGTNRFIIQNNGNVGIGSTSPESLLAMPGNNVITFSGVSAQDQDSTIGTDSSDNLRFTWGAGSGKFVQFIGGSQNLFTIGYSTTIFNESGVDNNFRIESDTDANAFYIDGGLNNVGIGTNVPSQKLDVQGTLNVSSGIYANGDAGTSGYFLTSSAGGANTWTDPDTITGAGLWDITSNVFHPKDEWAEVVDVVIGGTSTASADIQLKSNGDAYFGGNVGVNATSPSAPLQVSGTISDDSILLTRTANGGGQNWAINLNNDDFQLIDKTDSNKRPFRIANTAPNSALEILADGKVGLGLANPGSSLSVNGNLAVGSGYDSVAAPTNGAIIEGNVGIGTTDPIGLLNINGAVKGKALAILNETGNQAIFTASSSGTTQFVIANNGNVGIGTNNPEYQLDILEGSTTQAVRIKDSGGSGSMFLGGRSLSFESASIPGSTYSSISTPNSNGWPLEFYSRGLFNFYGIGGTSGNAVYSTGWINDGASAIAHTFSTGETFSTSGAKLVSFKNYTSEVAFIDKDGGASFGNNVGINSTSPGYALDVVGEFNLTDAIRVAGDAGTSGYVLTSSAGGANTWTDPSTLGLSYWANTNNVLHPKNEYAEVVDVVIGGTSTASADIKLGADGTGYFAGNVGIGSTSPGTKLDVSSTGDTTIRIKSTATNANSRLLFVSRLAGADKTSQISTDWNGNFVISPDGGKVGINTSTNSFNTLTVNGNTAIGNGYIGTAAPTNGAIIEGNVGIGTSAPGARLDVRNSGTEDILNLFDGGTEVLTVLDGGNVGIGGITNPGGTLAIPNTAASEILFSGAASTNIYQSQSGQALYLNTNTGALYLGASGSGSQNLTILNGGNVGIGTSTPTSRLEVQGGSSGSVLKVYSNDASYQANVLEVYNNSASLLFRVQDDEGVSMTSTAGHVIGSSSTNRNRQLTITGTLSALNNDAASLLINSSIVADDNSGTAHGLSVDLGGFTTDTTSSPSLISSVFVDSTTITNGGGGVPATAASLYINGAISGGTNNYALYVNGGTDKSYFAGNVGIGSTSPGYALDVAGELNLTDAIRSGGNAGTSGYLLTSSGGGAMTWTDPSTLGGGTTWWDNTLNVLHPIDEYASVVDLVIGGTSTASAEIQLFADGGAIFNKSGNDTDFQVKADTDQAALYVNAGTNNVGIGTSTPSNKLEVAGQVKSTFAGTISSLNFLTNDGNSGLYGTATGNVGLSSNGNDRLLIDNGGATTIRSRPGTTDDTALALKKDGSWLADEHLGLGWYTDADAEIGQIAMERISGEGYRMDFKTYASSLITGMTLDWAGNLGIGTTTPVGKLNVNGAVTGKALAIFNETGNQDIFAASASGTTRVRITNAGDILPGTDDSQNLGSSTFRWQDLYLGPASLHIGTDGNEGIVSYNTTSNYLGFDPDGDSTDEVQFTDAGGITLTDSTNPNITFSNQNGLIANTANTAGIQLGTQQGPIQFSVSGSDPVFGTDIKMILNTNGNVGIGSTAPLGLLDVQGRATGQALVQLQESGDQDILTASNSAGTTRFRMANNGYFYGERFADVSNSNYYLDPAAAGTSLAVVSNAGIGTTTPDSRLYVTGAGLKTLPDNPGFRTGEDVSGNYGIELAGNGGIPYFDFSNDAEGVTDFDARIGLYGDDYLVFDGANIGISSTAPNSILDIIDTSSAAGGAYITMQNTTATGWSGLVFHDEGDSQVSRIHHFNSSWSPSAAAWETDALVLANNIEGINLIADGASGDLQFFTGGHNERMIITNTGNVGIGSTSPGALFNVKGSHGAGSDYIGNLTEVTQTTSGLLTTYAYRSIANATHTSGSLAGLQANSTQLSITGSGGTTSYAEGLTAAATVGSGATVSNLSMQKIFQPSISGTVTNLKGIEIQNMTGGSSSNYSIYSLGGNMYHAGNIGIGTTNAVELLHVSSTTDPTIRLDPGNNTTADPKIALYDTGTTAGLEMWYDNTVGTAYIDMLYNNDAGDLIFRTKVSGTPIEAMRIDATGNIGIGDSTPTAGLHVATLGIDTTPNDYGVHMGMNSAAWATIELTGNGSGGYIDFQNDTGGTDYDLRLIQRSNSKLDFNGGVFVLDADSTYGRGILNDEHAINGLGSQWSMVPNAGFEINADTSTSEPDAWEAQAGAISIQTASGIQGNQYARLTYSGTTAELRSMCFPVTGGNGYRLNNMLKGSGAGHYLRFIQYSSYASCAAYTHITYTDADANGTATGTWTIRGTTVTANASATWARVILYNTASGTNKDVDIVTLTPNTGTNATADLAEYYMSEEPIEPGYLLTNSEILDVMVKKTSKRHDPIMGVVSTNPALLIGDPYENDPVDVVRVALTGRVPTIVSSENGTIKNGDHIVPSNSITGVGALAVTAGQTVGTALEPFEPSSSTCTSVNSLDDIVWPEDHLGTNPGKPCFQLADGTYVGKIMMFVNVSWYDPDVYLLDTDSLQINEDFNGEFKLFKNAQEYTRIGAFSKAAIAQLDTGLINAEELIVNDSATIKNLSIESLLINGQSLLDYITDIVVNQVNNQNTSGLISPVGNDTVISTASDSGQIVFNNAQEETVTTISETGDVSTLGKLIGKEVIANSVTASGSSTLGSLLVTNDATISGTLKATNTSLGNLLAQEATVSGSLTVAQDATVAGTLVAGQIDAASSRIAQLEAGMAELANLKATTAELTTATVSGTLYADNIYDFENKVTNTLKRPGFLELLAGDTQSTVSAQTLEDLYNTVNATQLNASSAAELDLSLEEISDTQNDVIITGTALFIEKYFKVNGAGYVSDSLAVGNSLFVGDTMVISDSVIAYNSADPGNQTLQIQPSGQGSIELLAGLVTLDDSGTVTVNGDFFTTGNARVEGTLLTDLIQPTDFGNPLQVQVAGVDTQSNEVKKSRFEIINEVGAPVATFSAQGDAEFTGSVKADGGLKLDSEDLGSSDTNELSANKTSGKATIKSGANEVIIKSEIITNETLIYVTAVGSTNNQVLYVKAQTPENTDTPEKEGQFTVGFDNTAGSDVTFNWWIVN